MMIADALKMAAMKRATLNSVIHISKPPNRRDAPAPMTREAVWGPGRLPRQDDFVNGAK